MKTIGAGQIRGRPGGISGIGGSGDFGTEGTLGITWYANQKLKLEPGVIVRNDHSWQVFFAFEWSFAGRD